MMRLLLLTFVWSVGKYLLLIWCLIALIYGIMKAR